MAVSISSQGTSPSSITEHSFSTARRGFDQSEVRSYLVSLAAEIEQLRQHTAELERDLEQAQHARVDPMLLDEDTLTRILGEETARVLTAARESAGEIRSKAEESAARMLAEASDDAARIREEAETDAARRRADATADAEAEVAMAKQQGREMVTEARAYRERVLAELGRRRELAREQIEQLIHGRDRLMQAFERARLVAVDVVSELAPVGEPDAYVDLSPTTGPVPVTVATQPHPRPEPTPPVVTSQVATEVASDVDTETIDTTSGDAPDDQTPTDETPAVLTPAEETPAEDIRTDDTQAERGDDAGAEDTPADHDAESAEDARADTPTDSHVPGSADPVVDDTSADAQTRRDNEPTELGAEEMLDQRSPADQPSPAGDPDARSDTVDNDVVVDLFARLRADTADAEPDAGNADVDAGEADVDAGEADVDAGEVDVDAGEARVSAADADAGGAGLDAGDADGSVSASIIGADDGGVQTARDDEAVELTDEDAAGDPFRHRDAEITPVIVSCAKKLKRVLADEQNDVLDRLRRSELALTVDTVLPDAAEQLVHYTDAVADDLLIAVRAGAASVNSDTVARLRKNAAADGVAAGNTVIEEWLITPMRDRLERCVVDGDGDHQGITKSVRALYREWKTQRIDEYLDDIVRACYGRGVQAAFEKGATVKWTLDPAHEACADCADNALARDVKVGEVFPTGHVFAPAHPGCCCLLVRDDR